MDLSHRPPHTHRITETEYFCWQNVGQRVYTVPVREGQQHKETMGYRRVSFKYLWFSQFPYCEVL
jgi:hypothetical protein